MYNNMLKIGESKAFHDRNLFVRGADIATQRGWTGVPNFILENDTISIGAKLTYAMLLKYAREMDECFPGQDRLAKDIGATRQSVNAYIKELSKAGMVDVKRRGQGRPNVYTVHIKASFWKRTKRS
jgi:biotin operon repressor